MSGPSSDVQQTPERSLNRQLVLEEEEYTAALSKIIARDFFPSLVHLDASNEYLDALQTQDADLIGASIRRLEQIASTPAPRSHRPSMPAQTPGRTPFGYSDATPIHSRPRGGEPLSKKARYDSSLSLDEFQAKYTSEDNSSFTQILDEENRVRKQTYGWAWEAQAKVERQRDRMIEQRERMLIEPGSATGVKGTFTIEAPKNPLMISDGSEEGKDADDRTVATIPSKRRASSEEPPVDVMAPRKDTRSTGVDGWKFKARNSLMFSPDADTSPFDNNSQSDAVKLKKVEYTNTRLAEQDETAKSRSEPSSPTRSHINAAIMGTPYRPKTPPDRLSLVPNVPSPKPAELGPAAMKQLMTWGTLGATPRIIGRTGDVAEAPGPFRIPDITAREALSHRLSNKAAKSLRAKAEMFTPRSTFGARGSGSMGPPSATPRRSEAAGNLTPAAKRLLERTTMGTAATRRAEAMERNVGWDGGSRGRGRDMERVRWTPTPSPVTRR